MILYENLVTQNRDAFIKKVKSISQYLGIHPDWLMAVMKNESGFNPRAENSIGAIGLIQFLPRTYRGLGYTREQMLSMSNVQQLDVVQQYFENGKGKFKNYTDLHLYAFFPAAAGKPDDWVLQSSTLSPQAIVNANPGFDLNKDGKITVGEYRQRVYERTVKNLGKDVADRLINTGSAVKKNKMILYIIIAVVGLGLLGMILYFKPWRYFR